MAELCVNIPDELKTEIEEFGNLSLIIRILLRKELQERRRLRFIISKSQLSKEDVRELSDKVNKSLSEKFKQSLK